MLSIRRVILACVLALVIACISANATRSRSYNELSLEEQIDYMLSNEQGASSVAKPALAKRFDNILQPRFATAKDEKCHDQDVKVECTPKLATVASKEYLINDKSSIAGITSCSTVPKGDEVSYVCDDFGRFQQLAIKAKPVWDQLLRDFVQHLIKNKRYTDKDVIAIPAPIKHTSRAREKGVRYAATTGSDGGAAGVSDYVRGGLVFRTFALLKDALCELNTFLPKYEITWEGSKLTPFSVLDSENKFLAPQKSCYSDFNLKIKFKGLLIELQTNFCSMFAAKEQTHGIYEQMRKLPETSPDAIALQKKLIDIHKAAWPKTAQDSCTLDPYLKMTTATFEHISLSPPKPAVPFTPTTTAAVATSAAAPAVTKKV